MKEKISFSAQYNHPKWQKKRLEALSDSDFTCQRCLTKDKTLHVHHKRYSKNRLIWEYELIELEVLCEECHADAHYEKDILQDFLSRFPSQKIYEFISIISCFSSKANGFNNVPIDDILESNIDPFNETLGEIIGVLYNRCSMYDLLQLQKNILCSKNNQKIEFEITKRNGDINV
jgi:hypothetical protein